MSEFTDAQIAGGLRQLSNQPCTPPGFDRRLVREIKDRQLAKFHEWPSGHWAITPRGRNFLMDLNNDL